MPVYFNPATDKYPLAKLNIAWDSLTLPDKISFSECIYTATADVISLFGVLDDNCSGIIKSKDKDWKPNNELAALFIYAKEKDTWDVSAGKYVTQKVHPNENYLFVRLTDQLQTIASDAKFAFSSCPLPNPTIQTLVDKNEPDKYMALMEELIIPHVIISAATTELITPEKSKPFYDAISKNSSSANGSGKFNSYKPTETQEQKLVAKANFILAQMKPNYEAQTISELVYNIAAIDDKPGFIALDALVKIVGGQ